MKQQINLYLSDFKVKKDALSVLLISQILGAVIVLMILNSGYELITRWQLNGEISDLQISLAEETRKTEELDGQLALRSQSDELVLRLEQAEARLDSRRQIRTFLSESKLGNVAGFSEYFKDLSRASIEGLSITEFSFSRGGDDVSVVGRVIDSAMVPRFVSNLESSTSTIKGKHFSPSISRADIEDQYFLFELRTSNE